MNKKVVLSIIIFIVTLIVLGLFFLALMLSPTSKTSKKVQFTIEKGTSTKEVINNLYNKDLIRNKSVALLYVKLNKNIIIKAGSFSLNKTMNLKDIFNCLIKGTNESKTITFVEGKRVTYYAKKISVTFGYDYSEIIDTMNDVEYLKALVNKYEFLTDEILNKDIYYPLEGYLFPDTYTFNKTATIKEIIETLLDNFEKKIKPYKEIIDNGNYSLHEIIALASIVELEGNTDKDRALIAGVFYNRLNINMSLGSDITTYYAVKKEVGDVLTVSDFNTINAYNTRATSFAGLPASAVCNPSISAIDATINYENNNNYYFYADGNGVIYYAETYAGHLANINAHK